MLVRATIYNYNDTCHIDTKKSRSNTTYTLFSFALLIHNARSATLLSNLLYHLASWPDPVQRTGTGSLFRLCISVMIIMTTTNQKPRWSHDDPHPPLPPLPVWALSYDLCWDLRFELWSDLKSELWSQLWSKLWSELRFQPRAQLSSQLWYQLSSKDLAEI